jgi:hypothetical protein
MLAIGSCNKTDLSKYNKDSLTLKVVNNLAGDPVLSWDQVATSDFVKYEIYFSGKPDIDITNNTAGLLATIADKDINTFEIPSFLPTIDSANANATGKIYFKVAAVLANRKLASNALEQQRASIFSSQSATLAVALPELNTVFFNENNFGTQSVNVDLNTGSTSTITWPFVINPFFGGAVIKNTIRGGTNAAGEVEATEIPNQGAGGLSDNIVRIYSANDFSLIKTFSANLLSTLYGGKMQAGKIFIIGQNLSGNPELQVYDRNSSALVSQFPLPNWGSQYALAVSNDASRVYVVDIIQSTCYSLSYNTTTNVFTQTASNASLALTSLASITATPDGEYMMEGSTGKVFNKQLQEVASVANISQSTGLAPIISSVGNGSNFIHCPGNNNVSLYATNTAQKIKSTTIAKGINAATAFFQSVDVFEAANGNKYGAMQVFNQTTGGSITLLNVLNL